MTVVRYILDRFRPGSRLPQPAPRDRIPATAPTVRPGEATTHKLNFFENGARPSPPALPPRRTPAPAAVPPPRPPSGRGVSKLAALTPALGRKKAGQALWAPHLLTPAERQTAARILKELDQ